LRKGDGILRKLMKEVLVTMLDREGFLAIMCNGIAPILQPQGSKKS
jgi:hypothetical protein